MAFSKLLLLPVAFSALAAAIPHAGHHGAHHMHLHAKRQDGITAPAAAATEPAGMDAYRSEMSAYSVMLAAYQSSISAYEASLSAYEASIEAASPGLPAASAASIATASLASQSPVFNPVQTTDSAPTTLAASPSSPSQPEVTAEATSVVVADKHHQPNGYQGLLSSSDIETSSADVPSSTSVAEASPAAYTAPAYTPSAYSAPAPASSAASAPSAVSSSSSSSSSGWYQSDLSSGSSNSFTATPGADGSYVCYSGSADAYPSMDQWVSYESMWNNYHQQVLNSNGGNEDYVNELKESIANISSLASFDSRIIFAIVLQESGAGNLAVQCSAGVDCGIMQTDGGCSFMGQGSGTDCPTDAAASINRMVQDGVMGTKTHPQGFAQLVTDYKNPWVAARAYNSGPNSNLVGLNDCATGTPAYVNDLANRLMGWVCTQDSPFSNKCEGK